MIEAPATHADWLALLAGRGIEQPARQHRAVLTQMAAGPAWAYRPAVEAPPCALVGIIRHDGYNKLWFAAGRDLESHLLMFVRLAGRRIAAERKRLRWPIVAHILAANTSGQRLAWAVGLQKHCGGLMQLWSTD